MKKETKARVVKIWSIITIALGIINLFVSMIFNLLGRDPVFQRIGLIVLLICAVNVIVYLLVTTVWYKRFMRSFLEEENINDLLDLTVELHKKINKEYCCHPAKVYYKEGHCAICDDCTKCKDKFYKKYRKELVKKYVRKKIADKSKE